MKEDTGFWARRANEGRCVEVVRYAGRRRKVRRCLNPAKVRVTQSAMGIALEVCGVHVRSYEPERGNTGGWEFVTL